MLVKLKTWLNNTYHIAYGKKWKVKEGQEVSRPKPKMV